MSCFPARKMFCVGFIHPKLGEGELGEGGPGERREPDVPWWFGLGWGWWRRVCDPVTLLSLQSVCFFIFGGAWVGGIWVENKGYRKLLKALSCGCSPGLLRGFGRALRAQGSRLSWALQCLCLCQSREVPALGLSLFLQPPWVPGAAWLCPSPAASYLVSVITWLLQLLFLSGEGTFVSQEMAPECGSSGSAVELLLCSSQGSAAAPEAAGPKSLLASGRRSCRVKPAVI